MIVNTAQHYCMINTVTSQRAHQTKYKHLGKLYKQTDTEYACMPSKALIFGVALILAGLMVFAYAYFTGYTPNVVYDNGHAVYADYVYVLGGSLVFLGLFVLVWFPFRKWTQERGGVWYEG